MRILLSLVLAAGLVTRLAAAQPTEAALLAVLGSSSDLNAKARACHELASVATPAAVPALAALLDHEQLSDYARIALEPIPGPEAGAVLREALKRTEGRRLAGVVNSLGVRRDQAAVPELRMLALDNKRGVAADALAALGLIATPAAAKALQDALAKGPADLRVPAGHAALVAAERLAHDGKKSDARKLLDAIARAQPSPQLAQIAQTQAAALGNKR